MLIDFRTLFPKYGIKPTGVIQIGAHWSEEHEVFVEMGINKIIYIEPCAAAVEKIIEKLRLLYNTMPLYYRGTKEIAAYQIVDIKILQAACGEIESEMKMFVSHNNQGQSNSLLKPNLHLSQHPDVVFTDEEIVKVIPLDKIPFDRLDYNVLILDTQGYEGHVLKGGIETLNYIDCIYTECNRGQTYEGNMEIEEMDEFLKPFGFFRMETYWPSPKWTWGDCLFVKVK